MSRRVDKKIIQDLAHQQTRMLIDFLLQSRKTQEIISKRFSNVCYYLTELTIIGHCPNFTQSPCKAITKSYSHYQLFLGEPEFLNRRQIPNPNSDSSIELVVLDYIKEDYGSNLAFILKNKKCIFDSLIEKIQFFQKNCLILSFLMKHRSIILEFLKNINYLLY